ncbi:Aste57867_17204 [Aphanomyces stellatus]|uniref:Aste57867_17204 protein n=1 Tax=Aphanomyces stellatus TaxID=120398 RepID=A0A485LAU6_9STRA|nr:hypothetical protein As57867_017145 [Aphanomyces stellatus]VFT93961.1 Aste57867_17204 [Aphanomyces stellatus]
MPELDQGANAALEDAGVLVELFSARPHALHDMLETYTKIGQPRCTALIEGSRSMCIKTKSSNAAFLNRAVLTLLAVAARWGFNDAWAYDYNQEVVRALAASDEAKVVGSI